MLISKNKILSKYCRPALSLSKYELFQVITMSSLHHTLWSRAGIPAAPRQKMETEKLRGNHAQWVEFGRPSSSLIITPDILRPSPNFGFICPIHLCGAHPVTALALTFESRIFSSNFALATPRLVVPSHLLAISTGKTKPSRLTSFTCVPGSLMVNWLWSCSPLKSEALYFR